MFFYVKIIFFYISIFYFFDLFAYARRNILIIQSNIKEKKWEEEAKSAIFERIGHKYSINVLDLGENNIFKNIKTLSPDLIILMNERAFDLLGQKISALKIPVVFLEQKFSKKISLNYYITGTRVKPILNKNINMIKELIYNPKNVLIIFDNSKESYFLYLELFGGKNFIHYKGVNLNIDLVSNFSLWKSITLHSKNQYSAIIICVNGLLNDIDGRAVSDDELMGWVSKHSPVPVFSFWEKAIGKEKAIGGYVTTGYLQGIEAASIADKIMMYPRVLPVSIKPSFAEKGIAIFSKNQIKKWNLNLNKFSEKEHILID